MSGVMVRHTVPGASTKDQAVNLFFEALRSANGTRRTRPEDLVEVRRVSCVHGLWTVYYTVPSRVHREIIGGEP